MKQLTTILCSIAFLLAGAFLASSTKKGEIEVFKHQTLSAATIPDKVPVSMLPLDLQLDLGKSTISDTAIVKRDTVFVDRPQILVINKKRSEVDRPKGVTDVAWMMFNPGHSPTLTVSKQKIPDREEDTGECDVGSPKESAIQLTVDGEVVYSKNVNHSTGGLQLDYCGLSQSGTCLAHFRWVSLAQVRRV